VEDNWHNRKKGILVRPGRPAGIVLAFLSLLGCFIQAQQKKPSCKVAIDIGHTEKAQGATSAHGVGEFVFNRDMAHILVDKLVQDASTDAFILDGTGKSLKERVTPTNLKNADLLVSIHHDSVQPQYLSKWVYNGAEHSYSDQFNGYSLFISRANPHPDQSLTLATDIGSHLLQAGFTRSLHHAENIPGENRPLIDAKLGIYQYDDLIILKLPPIPAVLLECGVIVNRQEESELSDPNYMKKMAAAVAAGIEDACGSFASSPPRITPSAMRNSSD